MTTLQKAQVTIAGVKVSGHATIAWKFQTGVAPYMTVLTCTDDDWERILNKKLAQGVTLTIVDSRGVKTEIKEVSILHKVASGKPTVTSFVVADRRWKWNRVLIARAYNISRKTGDVNFFKNVIPIEAAVTTAAYDYRTYSLKGGDEVWTARAAFEDAIHQLEDPADVKFAEGFSASDEFSLQNVILRDQGDVALARLMSFIPGTNVWVDRDGKIQVINTFDQEAAETHLKSLPPATWDGDKSALIDRRMIRPKRVNVYYEREVEAVLTYSDNFSGGTSAPPSRDKLYIENVIPTVDPETTVYEYDPETNKTVKKVVGPGTYVEVSAWLEAMDKVKRQGSQPWNFDTLKVWWVAGNIEGALMPDELRGKGKDDTTNVLNAIQALKDNFRQTFRISRRYMQRLQSIEAIRATLLDPVTGRRQPSSVWSQVCLIPTSKGKKTVARDNPDAAGMYYNIDTLPEFEDQLVKTSPSPQRLNFLDPDAGIFRLDSLADPYGGVASLIPCHVVNASGQLDVPSYNLEDQDKKAVGAGMRLQNGTNEIFLAPTMKFMAMVTIVAGAPNNKGAFHVEAVDPGDLADKFEGSKFRIQDGEGPVLEMFIPASEVTARFAWTDDALASSTISQLIGLNDDDPTKAGVVDDPDTPKDESVDLPGFTFVNHNREVKAHAMAAAAEMLQAYADSVHGRVSTIVPEKGGMVLKGNMSGATIQVSTAPTAKVSAVHEFPGQSQPVSRFALLPKSVRLVTLGIVRLK